MVVVITNETYQVHILLIKQKFCGFFVLPDLHNEHIWNAYTW